MMPGSGIEGFLGLDRGHSSFAYGPSQAQGLEGFSRRDEVQAVSMSVRCLAHRLYTPRMGAHDLGSTTGHQIRLRSIE